MKRQNIILILVIMLSLTLIGCNQENNDVGIEITPEVNNEENIVKEKETINDSATNEKEEKEDNIKIQEKEYTEGHLEVHFIDVGQGDSIFIKARDKNILIDGGDRGNIVPNYLTIQEVEHLDLVVGTHPHADHIGGLINVIENFEVKEIMDPGIVHTTKTYEDYLTLIDEKDIKYTEARTGMIRNYDGVDFEILHPKTPSRRHLNDSSVVIKVSLGEVSFLLTGDAERAAEGQMLSNNSIDLNSTFIKLGHHGSETSTTEEFLKAVDPEVSIITVGKNNRYKHPSPNVVNRVSNHGSTIYRTDYNGNIVVTTNGIDYNINTHRHGEYKFEESDSDDKDNNYTTKTSNSGTININTASKEELMQIIHIGESRADEIINSRPFNSMRDLTNIHGIGDGRLKDIKEEGKAYVE